MKPLLIIASILILAFVVKGLDIIPESVKVSNIEIQYAENVEFCTTAIYHGYDTIEQYEKETGCDYLQVEYYNK